MTSLGVNLKHGVILELSCVDEELLRNPVVQVGLQGRVREEEVGRPRLTYFGNKITATLFLDLTRDVAATCIYEILCCLVLDGFDLTTIHKLSSKENWRSLDLNPGLLGEKREHSLSANPPLPLK